MIVDHIDQIRKYIGIEPHLDQIADFMQSGQLDSLVLGRHRINDFIDVIIEEYHTKDASLCQFEGHLHHADLQLVLSGLEGFGYAHKCSHPYTILTPYQTDKDVEKQSVEDYTTIQLTKGMFALVCPFDLHMPKISLGTSTLVKKAIFKIKLTEDSIWQK